MSGNDGTPQVACNSTQETLKRGELRRRKAPKKYTAREIGLAGEDYAARYLEQQGLEVIERNWRCPFGEADIVCALKRDAVVLVEVKTRLCPQGGRTVAPELAVGKAKRARYGKIAMSYIVEHPSVGSIRFDVVAVTLTDLTVGSLRHIVNAFSWDD